MSENKKLFIVGNSHVGFEVVQIEDERWAIVFNPTKTNGYFKTGRSRIASSGGFKTVVDTETGVSCSIALNIAP